MPKKLYFPAINSEGRQQLLSLIPNAEAGNLYLITGERSLIWPLVQELTDHFAIRGPLRVVVGGNRISFERMPLHLLDKPSQFEKILLRKVQFNEHVKVLSVLVDERIKLFALEKNQISK